MPRAMLASSSRRVFVFMCATAWGLFLHQAAGAETAASISEEAGEPAIRTVETPWGMVRTPITLHGAGLPKARVVPPPEEPLPSVGQNVLELQMYVGETRVLPQPNAGRLAVGNGKILSAAVLDDKEILLIANDIGISSIHVWTKSGRSGRIKVTVSPGERAGTLHEIVDLMQGFSNVVTTVVGDKVIVDGTNLTEEQLYKLDMLQKVYPQIVNFTSFQKSNGGWNEMVSMDVKIVQFNKSKLRELGIKWQQFMTGPSVGIAGDVVASKLPNGPAFTANSPDLSSITDAQNLQRPITPFKTYFGLISVLTSQINLYERSGHAVVLADPQLTARSGKPASFQVGGRIPYPIVSTNGATSLQFEKFGVMLRVSPRVLPGGGILSEVKVEVSEVDPGIASVGNLPGIRTREAETVFNVRPGETMVLAGLLQRSSGETVDKIPGLGDIPVLGEFFRSKRKELTESELVIFITPTIVTPTSPEQTARVTRGEELIGKVEKIDGGGTPTGTEDRQP